MKPGCLPKNALEFVGPNKALVLRASIIVSQLVYLEGAVMFRRGRLQIPHYVIACAKVPLPTYILIEIKITSHHDIIHDNAHCFAIFI
jgi:hypothetical protein